MRSATQGRKGRAALRFTLDRMGRVQVRAVAQGAGNAALDAATLSILAPGGRLPPPPGHVAGVRFDLAIPITYTLRQE
jgi:TonB family protein